MPKLLKCLQGLTFCYLWFFSIFYGFIMFYIPLIPMVFVKNIFYRKLSDKIFAFWELYPTGLMQLIFGTKIYVHGDQVDPEETSLVIVNHRTRVDWNYLWMCMYHATRRTPIDRTCYSPLHQYGGRTNGESITQNGGNMNRKNCNGNNNKPNKVQKPSVFLKLYNVFNQKLRMKFVLKEEIRHIPGPGWVMQLNCFMYIKRQWSSDESVFTDMQEYFNHINYDHQLLIFPEGTDLSPRNIAKSDSFARKNNLETYRYVLHPRTKGFTSLCGAMSSRLAAIYDVTMAYGGSKMLAGGGCALRDMINGDFPPEVHFFIKRISVNTMPKDEEGLNSWINQRWKLKEEQLKSFYKHGRFVDASNRLENKDKAALLIAIVFWTSLVFVCPLLLIFSRYFRWYFGMYVFLFTAFNFLSRGFHHFEMQLFYLKANFLGLETKLNTE